ncbi:MAG: hypothetical protein E6G31_02185 [Actinobacteria bacterium]|nr:MAG: hypothetical protein E6G31_02185 [Actinomycetota bacterium]
MPLRFDDEFEHGLGWSVEGERLARTSHAIRTQDRVWLTDAVDGEGLDGRIAALGAPAGVVQLLDRHKRDCAAVADRLGVPLHVTPFTDVEGAPFVAFPIVRRRLWREVALWFAEQRILVCGDALGSLGYFRAPGEPFGVHPALRLFPPREALAALEPGHILFGHGTGFHGPEAPGALHTALATARRRAPSALLATVRSMVRR